jgi:predicted cupin superfamily sugar epimerase
MHQNIAKQFNLSPHPEGGYYRETIRLAPGSDGRSRMTAILFLLAEGEKSKWHRVDASELWLWHAGSPLTILIEGAENTILGADGAADHQPQVLIEAGKWQAAEANDGWALVSCVVAPGFEFDGFELAPANWAPPQTPSSNT